MSSAAALMAALGFAEADLAANRSGALSPAQVGRMKAAQNRVRALGGGGFVALVIAATTLIYAGGASGSPILHGAGVLLILLNAGLGGFAVRAWTRIGGDLRAGAVEALEGEVERVLRRGRAGDDFLLRIGGARLKVSREVFLAFQHQAPYRVYRARHCRVLLSAEPAC